MLISFLLGVAAGIITGLIPGIHPNLVVFLFSSADPWFVIPMAVVNSIVDMIPSILLGAPEPGTEMSVLPGHKLLMKGLGYDAIRRTIIGSLLSGVFAIFLIPMAVFISKTYGSISYLIPLILISITIITVREVFSLFLFVFSGVIGIISQGMNISQPLVPLLTGLFGVSRIITSLKTKEIPPQKTKVEYIPTLTERRSSFVGSVLGMFSGFLPGIGSSQSAYIASSLGGDFLTSLGSITTSNAIFSVLAFGLINKVRSGVATSLVEGENPYLLFSISLMSVSVGSVASLVLAKKISKIVHKINYRALNLVVLAVLVSVVLTTSGFKGLLLMTTASALGTMAITHRSNQSSLMGVVVIPTIVYFISKFTR